MFSEKTLVNYLFVSSVDKSSEPTKRDKENTATERVLTKQKATKNLEKKNKHVAGVAKNSHGPNIHLLNTTNSIATKSAALTTCKETTTPTGNQTDPR